MQILHNFSQMAREELDDVDHDLSDLSVRSDGADLRLQLF